MMADIVLATEKPQWTGSGFHKLEVHYFEDYMGEMLQVGMVGIDIPEGEISDEILFVE